MGARASKATFIPVLGTPEYDQSGKFTDSIRIDPSGTTAGTGIWAGNTFSDAAAVKITIDPQNTNFYFNDTNAWTIECWFKHSSATYIAQNPQGDTWPGMIVIANDDTDGNPNIFRIEQANTQGNSPYDFKTVTNDFGSTQTGTETLIGSTSWRHLAIVCDGAGASAKLAVYVDGTRKHNLDFGTTEQIRKVYFGIQGAFYSVGHQLLDLDEVRISDTARYSGTTLTVPTAVFTDDANTLALFHLDNDNPIDDGTVTKEGASALTNTATLTCRAGLILTLDEAIDPYTWDTVPSDTWDTFTSNIWGLQGLLVVANATVTANGGLQASGGANLEALASLSVIGGLALGGTTNITTEAQFSVTGVVALGGSASLLAVASVAADSTVVRGAAASISAETTTTATAIATYSASAAFAAASALTCDARNLKFADIYVDNFASLTATAGTTLAAQASLTAESLVFVEATRVTIGSANFSSITTVTVSPLLTLGAASSLSSEFTITALGQRTVGGTSAMSAAAATTAKGFLTFSPIINLQTESNVSVRSNGFFAGIALITASATLTAETRRLAVGQALLSSEFSTNFKALTVGRASLASVSSLTVDSKLTLGGSAFLDGFASYFPNGLTIRGARADLTAVASTSFTGDIQIVPGLLQFKILSETREWEVASEGRQLPVLSETRQLEIT